MKTLVINGCSFGQVWNPSMEFLQELGCDVVVNLSKPGTSFQRTCRSTVEWVAQHGSPDFVMIPITYAHRWELPAGDGTKFDNIDGNWIPVQTPKAMQGNKSAEIRQKYGQNKLHELSRLYYELIPFTTGYWDKLFMEIVLLCDFLQQRNIPYLMWDMCNDFDPKILIDHPHIQKAKIIQKNRRVIDIFSFCGNKHMWRSKGAPHDEDFNQHHLPQEYRILEKYLVNYIDERLR